MDIPGRIKASLEKIPGIYWAFTYGEGLAEEIDLMVVGEPDLQELDDIISQTEKGVGRAIDVTAFTLKEFRARWRAKEPFILEAVKGPKIMLIGKEKEIEAL